MAFTLAQLKTKIQQETASEDHLFIKDDELISYINSGIRSAEAEIHRLGQQDEYFLAKLSLALVTSQEAYSLPSDIYANKIRSVVYGNGSLVYEIRRIRGIHKFVKYKDVLTLSTSTEYYKYLLLNNQATGIQLLLSPPSYETSSSNVTIWYIRNAYQLTSDSDICDIPEFTDYVVQYCKKKIYEKEVGHPNYPDSVRELAELRTSMIQTLTDMVDDGDNLLEQDMSFYEEAT